MGPFDPTVRYAPIPDYPGYLAGEDGSLWSCRTPNGKGPYPAPWRRILGTASRKGYTTVRLGLGPGRSKSLQLHRLILEAFVGPCPEGMEACHGDGNPANNSPGNLRRDTPSANRADRAKHGRQLCGRGVHLSKLDEDRVREIRRLRANGWTLHRIRHRFGVAYGTVHAIATHRTWKHVT